MIFVIWLLLLAANLYMAKVNTDSFYKLMAQKQYHRANQARVLVVANLALAGVISVGLFFI